MCGGDLVQIFLLRLTGQRVKHCNDSVQSGKSESLIDSLIIFLLRMNGSKVSPL